MRAYCTTCCRPFIWMSWVRVWALPGPVLPFGASGWCRLWRSSWFQGRLCSIGLCGFSRQLRFSAVVCISGIFCRGLLVIGWWLSSWYQVCLCNISLSGFSRQRRFSAVVCFSGIVCRGLLVIRWWEVLCGFSSCVYWVVLRSRTVVRIRSECIRLWCLHGLRVVVGHVSRFSCSVLGVASSYRLYPAWLLQLLEIGSWSFSSCLALSSVLAGFWLGRRYTGKGLLSVSILAMWPMSPAVLTLQVVRMSGTPNFSKRSFCFTCSVKFFIVFRHPYQNLLSSSACERVMVSSSAP